MPRRASKIIPRTSTLIFYNLEECPLNPSAKIRTRETKSRVNGFRGEDMYRLKKLKYYMG